MHEYNSLDTLLIAKRSIIIETNDISNPFRGSIESVTALKPKADMSPTPQVAQPGTKTASIIPTIPRLLASALPDLVIFALNTRREKRTPIKRLIIISATKDSGRIKFPGFMDIITMSFINSIKFKEGDIVLISPTLEINTFIS